MTIRQIIVVVKMSQQQMLPHRTEKLLISCVRHLFLVDKKGIRIEPNFGCTIKLLNVSIKSTYSNRTSEMIPLKLLGKVYNGMEPRWNASLTNLQHACSWLDTLCAHHLISILICQHPNMPT